MGQVVSTNTMGDGTVKWDQVGEPRRSGWLVTAVGVLCLLIAACETTGDEASQEVAAKPKIEVTEPDEAGTAQEAAKAPLSLKPSSDDATQSGGLPGPEYYRGNGLLARDPSGGQFDPGVGENGKVTLNFANAEIRDVIDIVLGDTLGLNYIIDPGVQGTVTVRTSQPMSRADVIPALENILALSGVALTLVGGTYMVVPQDMAAGLSTPLVSPADRQLARGYGINIIPLSYASASAMQEILEPFVAPGSLRADSARNLLIYSGSGADARDLIEMVKVFDVDWMRGMSFALFPVQVADPKTLVADLETVFLQEGGSPVEGLIRFVPVERLSAVLAISPRSIYLDRAQTWIERLDRGVEGAGRRIFVYYVENVRAADLADILGQVFEGRAAPSREERRASLAPGLTPVELQSEQRAAQPEGVAEGAEATPSPARVRQTAAREAGVGQAVGGLLEESDIRIIADETSNSVLILSTAAEFRMIEATLKKLDVLPLQVLIEATIAEVGLNDQLRYGLQWFFESGDFEASLTQAASGAVDAILPGFNFIADFSSEARVVLSALTEITDVKVISSPSLMVLDNQSARLQVGDQVPVATAALTTAESITVTGDTSIRSEIQLVDTGVILEVTPRVNPGGLVTMEVSQEVSTAVPTTTSDLESPTIQQRQIESVVAVQSGDTVALGGLIIDEDSEAVTGVPLLSDIPILGNLFKTTTETNRRVELLVLITPRVVQSRIDNQKITDELRQRLRAIEPLEQKIKRQDQPSS
jgi:general secretion pathway protein D